MPPFSPQANLSKLLDPMDKKMSNSKEKTLIIHKQYKLKVNKQLKENQKLHQKRQLKSKLKKLILKEELETLKEELINLEDC